MRGTKYGMIWIRLTFVLAPVLANICLSPHDKQMRWLKKVWSGVIAKDKKQCRLLDNKTFHTHSKPSIPMTNISHDYRRQDEVKSKERGAYSCT
mmetsp:Transcript_25723/g.44936  ORF Transcript_25723/g.44936 Transcript_25723/m.44936 type:complete len:94 (+) Transcript_25723:152-433(+)